MADDDLDWLSDLRWRGYPHLMPVRDIATEEATMPTTAMAVPAETTPLAIPDPRVGELSRENEALRARLHGMGRAAEEFERRLREAGQSYEGALLDAESRVRDLSLNKEHLTGELLAARAELARLSNRDVAREADLRIERERRTDAEKALALARRQIEELTEKSDNLRTATAEQAGAIAELRRHMSAQVEGGA